MQLYILRHGIAEDGKPGQPDSGRALTAEGKRKLRGILKSAKEAGVEPTLAMTSPYRRAEETAALAVEALGYTGHLLTSEVLTPFGQPQGVWDELRVHRDEAQVLIVGHDPLFSNLTGFLLNSPHLIVDFKKGAIVRIDLDRFNAEPRGILKWMLVPKLAK